MMAQMYWQHTRYAGSLAQAKARLDGKGLTSPCNTIALSTSLADLDQTHRDYQSYTQTHPTPPSLSTALSLPLSTAAKRK